MWGRAESHDLGTDGNRAVILVLRLMLKGDTDGHERPFLSECGANNDQNSMATCRGGSVAFTRWHRGNCIGELACQVVESVCNAATLGLIADRTAVVADDEDGLYPSALDLRVVATSPLGNTLTWDPIGGDVTTA